MFEIHAIEDEHLTSLLVLNNTHAEELSHLSAEEFQRMSRAAFLARCIGDDAFIFAFDETANYRSPNFLWFKERHDRFVYIDRIVVAAHARGRGLAAKLYGELFLRAEAAGYRRIVCEVNVVPPNSRSDAFHARLGFTEVGQAHIHEGAKTVRYLERLIRG